MDSSRAHTKLNGREVKKVRIKLIRQINQVVILQKNVSQESRYPSLDKEFKINNFV